MGGSFPWGERVSTEILLPRETGRPRRRAPEKERSTHEEGNTDRCDQLFKKKACLSTEKL